jgi:hypothetical protein
VAVQIAFIPEAGRSAYMRARHGAWGAKNLEWREGKYRSLLTLSERFSKVLIEGVKQLDVPEPRLGFLSWVANDIEYGVPLIVWVHFSSSDIYDLKRGVWLELSPTYYDKKYYIEDVIDWKLPYARLDLYKASVESALREMEMKTADFPTMGHVILLYNPEKDDYEVWKVIPPRQT